MICASSARAPATCSARPHTSPEQARGHAIDQRTDVYAFGAVAFELITGRLPYPANNAADMIAMHLMQPVPSARALVPSLPLILDDLLARLLAKEPSHRPSLAYARDQLRMMRDQFAYGAISSAQHETGTTTVPQTTPPVFPTPPGYPTPASHPGAVTQPPASTKRGRRALAIIGAMLLTIAAGVGVFYAINRSTEPAGSTSPPGARPPTPATSTTPAATPPAATTPLPAATTPMPAATTPTAATTGQTATATAPTATTTQLPTPAATAPTTTAPSTTAPTHPVAPKPTKPRPKKPTKPAAPANTDDDAM